MCQSWQGAWGPWLRHDGRSMPVPKGTIVEAFSEEDPKTAKDGIVRRIGIAGIDLVQSWFWTPETRGTQSSLPIDLYRVMGPGCLGIEAARGRPAQGPRDGLITVLPAPGSALRRHEAPNPGAGAPIDEGVQALGRKDPNGQRMSLDTRYWPIASLLEGFFLAYRFAT